ncbi:unnamed protein product, partial [Trichobilharzia szidati]
MNKKQRNRLTDDLLFINTKVYCLCGTTGISHYGQARCDSSPKITSNDARMLRN